MSIGYTFEELMALLHSRAPAKADAVARHRRDVDHGLLSVGLKIHYLGKEGWFSDLVDGLSDPNENICAINGYRNTHASLCFVLPPVGSARVAILLLEAIEQFTGLALFGNPEIQIQICSPGKMNPRRAAIHSIGFYLGSDILRRYALDELETTFVKNPAYPRGKRIVLYDADGDFDVGFAWWERDAERAPHRSRLHIKPHLPFQNGRTDILTGRSRRDIENVNFLATLLTHAQFQEHWGY